MRRVSAATRLTGDPLVLPYLTENVRQLVKGSDQENQVFAAQDTAVTGTKNTMSTCTFGPSLNGLCVTSARTRPQ